MTEERLDEIEARYKLGRVDLESPKDVPELITEVRRLREALPDPFKLEGLADWLDAKFPEDPTPEVQTDLREWARLARAALGDTK